MRMTSKYPHAADKFLTEQGALPGLPSQAGPSLIGSDMASQQPATLFVVVGAQRTGTNLLREILNSNPVIAMLGEVFTPSSAPAHWDNFAATLPDSQRSYATADEVRAILDRYFNFVNYRVRNFWIDGDKSGACAIGVDIKYNQLRSVAPSNWQCTAIPYLIDYLQMAGAVFVHAVRRNLIHCAISAMIAEQRNIWHDYRGVLIDRSYTIDPFACIELARSNMRDRDAFVRSCTGAYVVECCYEDLVSSIESAGANGFITFDKGPLLQITRALGVEFQFRYDGRLRKAINIPYSRLIANHRDLVAAVTDSEFAAFAPTLV
jgi:hypothetical protein